MRRKPPSSKFASIQAQLNRDIAQSPKTLRRVVSIRAYGCAQCAVRACKLGEIMLDYWAIKNLLAGEEKGTRAFVEAWNVFLFGVVMGA